MKRTTQGPQTAESPEEFAARLGLTFDKYSLLARALTHRSYCNEHPNEVLEDNERLEFLGDAVLDFLVGAWLYNHFPEMREGELTRLRSALVRTEQLAAFAQEMGFGSAMRLGRGETEGGGRQRQALLCATFEAVVGALYLDSGFDSVRKFLEPILEVAVQSILASNSDQDPKSLLQERVQSQGYPPPTYRTAATTGPEHQKTFEVDVLVGGEPYAHGSGLSKQTGAKAAARAALEKLDQEPLPPYAANHRSGDGLPSGNHHHDEAPEV
jgi:ribonuclease-3